MARKYGKSPAQVLIRWCLEHDLVVIPKSVHEERIRENANVFDFSLLPEDLRRLDGLNENLYTGWDPTDVP
jgi:diketogulonate reductase-like aldo/keto reductase